jgi:hypothetical protein
MRELILKADERRKGHVGRDLTSHSTGADEACMSFARSDASLNPSRPVNSGVMLLPFALGEKHMKKLILTFWLIVSFTFAGQVAYACSCGKLSGPIVFNDNTPKPDPEEVKKW